MDTLFVLQVALQFPDSLLRDAPRVAQLIKEATRAEVVVLGDTSYGRLAPFWHIGGGGGDSEKCGRRGNMCIYACTPPRGN